MSPPSGVPGRRGAIIGRRLATFLVHGLWSVRRYGVEHMPADGPVIDRKSVV